MTKYVHTTKFNFRFNGKKYTLEYKDFSDCGTILAPESDKFLNWLMTSFRKNFPISNSKDDAYLGYSSELASYETK